MDNSTKLIMLKRSKLNLERFKRNLAIRMQETIEEERQIHAEWIEAILEEAAKFNLREEVKREAEATLHRNPDDISVIDAYQEAYNEWIK